MSKSSVEQAELMLRLFEMRREPEMRRARHFVMHEFKPTTWDEIHYLSGEDGDRWFRMVTSYWEMVAAFVNKGLLNEDLFFDTHGEDMVVWKKVQPIVAGARKHIRPTWLWNLEQVARRHLAWRERTFKTADKVIAAGSKLRAGKSGAR